MAALFDNYLINLFGASMKSYAASKSFGKLRSNKTLSVLSIAGVAMSLALTGCSNNESAETTTNADGTPAASQNIELLNVSYDVARDFYKDYNPMFVEHYKTENPDSEVLIKQSHGG